MSSEPVYSLQVLDRFGAPRNYGPLGSFRGHARITGPCGDTMEFWIQVSDQRVTRLGFTTTGCGPSRAAGSMATELAQGRTVAEVLEIGQADVLRALGGLPVESEHCALLAVSTLRAAVRDYQERCRKDEAQQAQQDSSSCGETATSDSGSGSVS